MKFDILAQFIALELGRAKRAKKPRRARKSAAKKSQKRVFRRAGSTGFGAEFELRREDLRNAYEPFGVCELPHRKRLQIVRSRAPAKAGSLGQDIKTLGKQRHRQKAGK